MNETMRMVTSTDISDNGCIRLWLSNGHGISVLDEKRACRDFSGISAGDRIHIYYGASSNIEKITHEVDLPMRENK